MNQRERFEAAWRAKWPSVPESVFERDADDKYTLHVMDVALDGFRLGEASGLERAARACDRLSVTLDYGGNEYKREATSSQCARSIRTLLAREGE